MNRVLILVGLCIAAAAMVPRERRAVNTEEEIQPGTSKPICAAATPCGWAFYKLHNTLIESHAINDYCQCDVNTTCQLAEDDISAQSFIKRCKPPSTDPEGENYSERS